MRIKLLMISAVFGVGCASLVVLQRRPVTTLDDDTAVDLAKCCSINAGVLAASGADATAAQSVIAELQDADDLNTELARLRTQSDEIVIAIDLRLAELEADPGNTEARDAVDDLRADLKQVQQAYRDEQAAVVAAACSALDTGSAAKFRHLLEVGHADLPLELAAAAPTAHDARRLLRALRAEARAQRLSQDTPAWASAALGEARTSLACVQAANDLALKTGAIEAVLPTELRN